MSEERNCYEELLRKIDAGEGAALETSIKGEEGFVQDGLQREIVPVRPSVDGRGRAFARVLCEQKGDGWIVTEPVLPKERLIVMGGGHVSLEICMFAARCGFQVTVCDDRPEFADPERFPMAEQVLCAPFTECIDRLEITPYDFLVIVTRGHAHDGECVRKILSGTEPAYTGLIGSRSRVRAQFEMMEKEGLSRERLNRICTPIGLDIGSVTPAEIAVSIVAELIAYRRKPENNRGRICKDTDLEIDVIRRLAAEHGPMAAATILAAEGSSPRGAGAKMLIKPDGSIFGTIGGGWGEAKVMREAAEMIGSGKYRVRTIEMNADVAAKEGMACGGSMRVLIEDVPADAAPAKDTPQ